MTPEEMAAIHAESFTYPRPWTAAELAGLLASPLCFLLTESRGFLIGRAVAGEAELLTLAVAPEARRGGRGARLVARFLDAAAARGAETAFLEVAADNTAAQQLYARAGFAESGRRRGYYATGAGVPVDAVLMARVLAQGQPAKT
ncbi:MAG: ribosomal protein S18-alanine N-acetyltransferase [Paracoccaceae bacterium]